MNANQRRRDRRSNPLSARAMRYDIMRRLRDEAIAKLDRQRQERGPVAVLATLDGTGQSARSLVWLHPAPHQNSEVLYDYRDGAMHLLDPAARQVISERLGSPSLHEPILIVSGDNLWSDHVDQPFRTWVDMINQDPLILKNMLGSHSLKKS